MRICHIASGDLWAGAEVVLNNLLQELHKRGGIELSTILLNDRILAERLRAGGIQVKLIPEDRHGLFSLYSMISDELSNLKPDIVHTHRYKEHILGGFAARRSDVGHLVCSIHGMPEPVSGLQALKAGFKFMVERYVFRRLASALVSVSYDIARLVKPMVTNTPVVVIHNGIRLPAHQLAKITGDPDPDPEHGEGVIRICTAGRLNPVKAYDILIRAAATLQAKGMRFRLLIIGDGPLRGELEEMTRRFGLEATVEFVGFVSNPQEIIRGCDVFVLSSSHEGISIALLEAMSLGKATVVTAVGGNPEVVQGDASGLLVPPGDHVKLAEALQRLIIDRQLRQRLGEAGRNAIADHFTDEAMASATLDLYRRLVEKQNKTEAEAH